jgi:hypothetical protein
LASRGENHSLAPYAQLAPLGLSAHWVNFELDRSAVFVLVLDFPLAGLVPLDLLEVRKVVALLERVEDAR